MRKVAAVAAIVCLAPAGLGFGPPTLVESPRAVTPLYAGQVVAIQSFQPPTLSAASALLSEERSDARLFTREARLRRPMASLTKMMTALLAVERGQLDERVTVRVDSGDLVGSSVMGLRRGEQLTLEDLLYGLLLPSGNDAAIAIAEHVGGSVGRFVSLMNERATELGMNDTHFANPHGLDEAAHFSTAEDLLILAGKAMENPTLAGIVRTKERTVAGKMGSYELRNTNRLLWEYEGVLGIKTGDTDDAGQCLVVMAQRGEERLFAAVLGSTARFDDTKNLLDYFYSSFSCRRLGQAASAFDKMALDLQAASPGSLGSASGTGDSGIWDCRPSWQARWQWATQ